VFSSCNHAVCADWFQARDVVASNALTRIDAATAHLYPWEVEDSDEFCKHWVTMLDPAGIDMKDVAALIQAISSLLWPILALAVVLIFRSQIGEVLGQFKRMKKGKFFGQEIELSEKLVEDDDSSRILNAYLLPNGTYSPERLQTLNALLRDLGVVRDVRLILDGEGDVELRKNLIRYAKEKGFGLDAPATNQASG
jgi:hypothetical protein